MYNIKMEIEQIKTAKTMKDLLLALKSANLYSEDSGLNINIPLTWINDRIAIEDVGRHDIYNKKLRKQQQLKYDEDMQNVNHFVDDKTNKVLTLKQTKNYIVKQLKATYKKMIQVNKAKNTKQLYRIYPINLIPGLYSNYEESDIMQLYVEENNPMPDVRKKLIRKSQKINHDKYDYQVYYKNGSKPSFKELQRQVINRLIPISDVN